MSKKERKSVRTSRLSLSIQISMGLVLATIIPLLITVVFSELQTRPTLVNQANREMQSDVKTRVQLIDTYLNERLADTETLTQIPSVPQFLATPPPPQTPIDDYKPITDHAAFALEAGKLRDHHYTTWALFNGQGQPALYYPQNTQPTQHGQYIVPQEDLKRVQAGQIFVSAVYYSSTTQHASVDIYAPVLTPDTHIYLGFARASLNLDYIWGIVADDQSSNGTGSQAFILDQNGVHIADTNPIRRFKSVASLPEDVQQRIQQEARYGNSNPVPVLTDTTLANALHHPSHTLFQAQPAGENESFQIVRQTTSVVPWNYFVLSPVSTVTTAANQQLFTIALIALAVSLLVAFFGLLFGRRITRPILRSVELLRTSSEALSLLASKQQDAATEQRWVVDSSQVGLQSVQYYASATEVAAHQLSRVGIELAQKWDHIHAQEARQSLDRMIKTAQYIENSSQYQNVSNQKLDTALKVATQVTEQLVAGTTSATDAATQLQQVVQQLRRVVGK